MNIIMKRLLFINIIIISLLYSCQSAKNEANKPENLIEKEQFEQILSDLEKAEAYIHMQYTKQNKISPEEVYLSVFSKHHVTKTDFDSSLDYYAHYPEYLEDTYNRILENISKEQAGVNAELSKQKEKEDTGK
ncbi:MAG TPA: hypothetical protein DIU39_08760 [Flavobacteriales bacterium]|nr:hypothetical protein [Flavobacteriales bacterium]|tara:strand:- start:81363 stop:81761 length:399 start_codon:yes stop_codon:yes gene_type:complete